MEPHTDKQLQTAFKFVNAAYLNSTFSDVAQNWKNDKGISDPLYWHPSTIAVRALLLLMCVDPDVHCDDYFWVNVYESDNGDRFISNLFASKKLADNELDFIKNTLSHSNPKRIAVKRIKVGDTE